MSVIFLLLTVSTLVAGVFLLGFIWAVSRGQYDDDRSPAVRILLDDRVGPIQPSTDNEQP
ncbi:MAG: cbb3-type cytochrome oxidase assembly protein CcoS [Flavobacteriales bacterium]|nr:cbb3-type cytochrome oxidase assembly protein CcoS [Flavobacteriales bacterium]HPF90329.1 cbb3-type cytochrome oxidase assembly protein CcoS [Flavobacteriales bacterium]